MRLIDADWLQERLAKEPMENRTYFRANEIIVDAPTAYDVDKVEERLEEYAHSRICKTHERGCPYLTNNDVSCENCGAIGALEIVKFGGIE